MYSTLAGFVEPGETLEEAVRRECIELIKLRAISVGRGCARGGGGACGGWRHMHKKQALSRRGEYIGPHLQAPQEPMHGSAAAALAGGALC